MLSLKHLLKLVFISKISKNKIRMFKYCDFFDCFLLLLLYCEILSSLL